MVLKSQDPNFSYASHVPSLFTKSKIVDLTCYTDTSHYRKQISIEHACLRASMQELPFDRAHPPLLTTSEPSTALVRVCIRLVTLRFRMTTCFVRGSASSTMEKEDNLPSPRYTIHTPGVKACSLRGLCPCRPIETFHPFQPKTTYANDTANDVLNSQPHIF